MTEVPNRLVPLPSPPPPEPSEDERGYQVRSTWPVTRGAALGMTALLSLAVGGLALAQVLGSELWMALLLPVLTATLAARLVFESVDGALGRRGPRAHLLAAAAGAAVGALTMAVAALILGIHQGLTVELAPAALGLVVLIGAGLVRDLEVRLRQALRRVYFAGSADGLRELERELRLSPQARLVGAVAARPPLAADALERMIRSSRATVLVIDRSAADAGAVVEAATVLGREGLLVRDLLGYYESEFQKVPLTELTPAWFLFEHPAQGRRAIWAGARRLTVMSTSAILLIASLPLLGLLMLAVRLTSPGPAIFRQPRVGKDGTLFTLVKLRTMTVADDGAAWATDQAHRITPLGRVLRRYRLDELPQLWNVLRGELAFIGPRPEQVTIVERLKQQIPFYDVRHSVRPGITGWAQVNLGYSGSLQGTRAKLQRDLYYVKHRSLRLDLLILWLTLTTVFTDPR